MRPGTFAAVVALALAVPAGRGLAQPAGEPQRELLPAPQLVLSAGAAKEQVERWINQLGDANYRVREEAGRRLQELGVEALAALRGAKGHADPEVRRRARELAEELETASLLATQRVTLELKGKSARECVQALAGTTGYKIECFGGSEEQKHSFAWKDVPFWTAVDELCRVAGLMIMQGYGDDRLRLHFGDRYAPYTCQDGAFRVVAGGFQQNRSIDFATFARGRPEPARQDSMTFTFTVQAEPRLPLLGISEVRLLAAYDNENNSLVPPPAVDAPQPGVPAMVQQQRVSRFYGGGQRQLSYPAEAALVRSSGKAAVAKLIRGTADVTVLVDQKPVTVTDNLPGARGKKVKLGDTTIAVEEVGENPAKQVQVKLSVTQDGVGQDYSWTNSLYTRLEVLDEKGTKIGNHGSSWSHSSPNHVQMTLHYPAGTKPMKLVYSVWTTLGHKVAFEFRDLPLP